MVKIGTIRFPQEMADQVADCYTRLPLAPKEVKIKDTYVYNESGEDVRAFSIFEYRTAHKAVAAEYLETRYQLFSKIPGLTYSVEDWLSVADALAVVGTGDFSSQFSIHG
jgi:predicted ester cyclase